MGGWVQEKRERRRDDDVRGHGSRWRMGTRLCRQAGHPSTHDWGHCPGLAERSLLQGDRDRKAYGPAPPVHPPTFAAASVLIALNWLMKTAACSTPKAGPSSTKRRLPLYLALNSAVASWNPTYCAAYSAAVVWGGVAQDTAQHTAHTQHSTAQHSTAQHSTRYSQQQQEEFI